MSDLNPNRPYIYQPYGMQHKEYWKTGRIFGIGGIWLAKIDGLTRAEAEVLLTAIKNMQASESAQEETGK